MLFVDFNQAKKLKEKGFSCQYPIAMYNELGDFHALYTSADHNPNIKSVFGNREYYDYDDFDDKDYICPTISQVLKWLREKKEVDLVIEPIFCYDKNIHREYGVRVFAPSLNKPTHCGYFNMWEKAAIAGIEYVLDNLI